MVLFICTVDTNFHDDMRVDLFVSVDDTYHGTNNELRELPPVELSTLPKILKVQS